MTECPFAIGSLVTWVDNVPSTWRFTITPGPMQVVLCRWDDGTPSEYSMKFGGIPRIPGWIVIVEYDADSTNYYDPPLSNLLGLTRLRREFHQMWLKQA